MKTNVLVLAAHPDDEVLGCGGALARHADEGADIHVAFLADGVNSRDAMDQSALAARREAARRALIELGIHSVSFGDLPDNRLDTVPLLDLVKLVEAQIASHRPDTLYTHHAGDVNIDHRRLHEAAIAATRPQLGQTVRTMLFFEIASSTEWQPPGSAPAFTPNWFVDIGAQLERKLRALDAYAMELRPWPHPRSRRGVEHLARWRGATVGAEAAEAFILGRRIA